MPQEFWVNLPVKDIERSKNFFIQLGFTFGSSPGNTPTSAPLLIGSKNTMVMLFEESTFKGFVKRDIMNTEKYCEVLLSFDVSTKEEVDEIALKVIDAGGSTEHHPYKMEGYMYGCVFSDPDGHKWNVLYVKK